MRFVLNVHVGSISFNRLGQHAAGIYWLRASLPLACGAAQCFSMAVCEIPDKLLDTIE